ncbi:MAG: hypothetical protein ACLP9L_41000, partial [Thermoguttaceae bacterium]
MLTASLTLTNGNSVLDFAYTDNVAASVPSIMGMGADGNLTFSTGSGGFSFIDPAITATVNGNSANVTAFPNTVNTIEISGPTVGTETFKVLPGGGSSGLQLAEKLLIDSSVNQAEFDAAVTAGSIVANTAMDLNGGTVTTSNGQIYGSAVTLSADTMLTDTGGNAITFNSTVDSEAGNHYGLQVNTSGVTWFHDNVGNTTALGYLTTDAPGQTNLGGNTATEAVKTVVDATHNGNQTYGDAVYLYADTTITATAGATSPNVTFASTVDSELGFDWGLAVIDAGVTWFAGNVGTNSPLGYLTTDAAGTTYLGSETVPPPGAVATGLPMVLDTQAQSTGSAIATGGGAGGPGNHNGDVDFKDPVLLYADTTINALAYTGTPAVNPNVTFEKTVDSPPNQDWGLTVNDPGVTWFAGNVGANSPLGYLTAEGGGTTYLGSESVPPPGAVATGLPMVLDTQA